MAVIVSVLVFFAVCALVLAFDSVRQRRQNLHKRLQPFRATAMSVYQRTTAAPLKERLVKPVLGVVAQRATAFTPQKVKDRLRHQLLQAGNPGNLQASEFMAIKIVLSGVGLIVAFVLRFPLLWLAASGIIGWIGPDFYLRNLVTRRLQLLTTAIPDVLDLLTVSVEAGLGFDAAVAKVVEKTKGPLAEEFQRMLQEIRIGKPRRDALRNLSLRTGVEDLQGFVAALIQADQLGVSIGKILRIQSQEIRNKRRQRAEEAAMKAPIKMLFPLVIFVFPALFIVLLGPAFLQFLKAF